ncbi:MAG TPA: hypothetical protein VMM58_04755 [Bacteroidota bacterium]|nr:hypothetical protein [Bacteroidota bacterium]
MKLQWMGFAIMITGMVGCTDMGSSVSPTTPPSVPPGDTTVSFKNQVLPIIIARCTCHTSSPSASGFNPSTYNGLRAGGQLYDTTVVIPFDSMDSGIMAMLRSSNNKAGIRMPANGPPYLPDSLIVKIGTWIQQGALNN